LATAITFSLITNSSSSFPSPFFATFASVIACCSLLAIGIAVAATVKGVIVKESEFEVG